MLLDPVLAKRLRMKAIAEGMDIGALAGPVLEQLTSGFYWADRSARPAVAEPLPQPTAELGDGPKLAEGLG
jgi:hypothetical protein